MLRDLRENNVLEKNGELGRAQNEVFSEFADVLAAKGIEHNGKALVGRAKQELNLARPGSPCPPRRKEFPPAGRRGCWVRTLTTCPTGVGLPKRPRTNGIPRCDAGGGETAPGCLPLTYAAACCSACGPHLRKNASAAGAGCHVGAASGTVIRARVDPSHSAAKPWRQRTNVWREVTRPARRAKARVRFAPINGHRKR